MGEVLASLLSTEKERGTTEITRIMHKNIFHGINISDSVIN